MFRISAETCRRFTLAEILIMSAINVATIHVEFAGRVSPAITPTARRARSLNHCLQTHVRKAVQL